MSDTIFAVSSGMPPAAIAVMRLSGPLAAAATRALAETLPPPRRATLRTVRDPADGATLDRALILWFPGPHTATGEDLAEFHLHGGRAVVAAVARALGGIPGLRPANPGEFTRRALTNGRLDLAEAEGLGDLLMAETESQRIAAMASAEGAVGQAIAAWTRQLLELSARTEALLEFADEDDVETADDDVADIAAALGSLSVSIAAVLTNPPVDRLRDGIRVVLAGAPNAGKSTLLNALAERDAAIVSPIAGTTRDRIEVPVVRDGIAYLLTDTAGLADATDDPIERIGIERARRAIDESDIVILLDDTVIPPADARTIRIRPRADLSSDHPEDHRLPVSARTGRGVQDLWARVGETAADLLPRLDRLVLNRRQRDLCAVAAAALKQAEAARDPLIVAEQCRIARRAFDRITGASDTEDMLDALFGRFCIGK